MLHFTSIIFVTAATALINRITAFTPHLLPYPQHRQTANNKKPSTPGTSRGYEEQLQLLKTEGGDGKEGSNYDKLMDSLQNTKELNVEVLNKIFKAQEGNGYREFNHLNESEKNDLHVFYDEIIRCIRLKTAPSSSGSVVEDATSTKYPTNDQTNKEWIKCFIENVSRFHEKLVVEMKSGTESTITVNIQDEGGKQCFFSNGEKVDIDDEADIELRIQNSKDKRNIWSIPLKDEKHYATVLDELRLTFDPDEKKRVIRDLISNFETTYLNHRNKDYIPHLVEKQSNNIPASKTDSKPYGVDFQFTKARLRETTLVVSGESGAGKTQYALHFSSQFDATIYLCLNEPKLKVENTRNDKENLQYEHIENIIGFTITNKEAILDEFSYADDSFDDITTYLAYLQSDIFEERNSEALKAIEELVERAVNINSLCVNGWNKEKNDNENKLESLLLIIDEATRDVNLIRAMIDMTRTFIDRSKLGKLTKSMNIILCGTGLDLIESNASGSLGSDPTLYSHVTLKRVNKHSLTRDHLSKAMKSWACNNNIKDDAVGSLISCMESGSRLKILSSNARMLSMGVAPLLLSDFFSGEYSHYGDASGEKRKTILKSVSENKDVMDYVIRKYISLNSLKEVNDALPSLLNHSFIYFLLKSVKTLDIYSSAPVLQYEYLYPDFQEFVKSLESIVPSTDLTLDKLEPIEERNKIYDCFAKGICTPDPKTTSDAMKYFICRGESLFVHPRCGFEFEELVANFLHVFYMATTERDVIKYTLQNQIETRLNDETIKQIQAEVLQMKENHPHCQSFIITQRFGNNAAGPDVIVWRKNLTDGQNWYLDLYQVKHISRNTFMSLSKGRVKSVMNSLFIKKDGDYDTSIERMFTLENNYNTRVARRILQTSLLSSDFVNKKTNNRWLENCNKIRQKQVEILSREFLQPTFDVGKSFMSEEEGKDDD